jgi:hypothetical protein
MLIRPKNQSPALPNKSRNRLLAAAPFLTMLCAVAAWSYSHLQLHTALELGIQPSRLDVRAADANQVRPTGNLPNALWNAELARQWDQVSQASAVELVSLQFTPVQDGIGLGESLLGWQMALSLRGAYKDVRQVLGEMLSTHPELQLRQLQVRPAADGSAAVEAELQLVWLRMPRPMPRGAP